MRTCPGPTVSSGQVRECKPPATHPSGFSHQATRLTTNYHHYSSPQAPLAQNLCTGQFPVTVTNSRTLYRQSLCLVHGFRGSGPHVEVGPLVWPLVVALLLPEPTTGQGGEHTRVCLYVLSQPQPPGFSRGSRTPKTYFHLVTFPKASGLETHLDSIPILLVPLPETGPACAQDFISLHLCSPCEVLQLFPFHR